MKVKPGAESFQGTPTSLLERLPLANHRFQPVRQKSAEGASPLRRKDTRFAEKVGVKFKGYVCLHSCSLPVKHVKDVLHNYTCVAATGQAKVAEPDRCITAILAVPGVWAGCP